MRIVKATGAVRSTLELLGSGGDLLRLLLSVASLSTKLSETLAEPDRAPRFSRGGGAGGGTRPIRGLADALPRLARRHEESLLFIHSRNPIPENGPEILGPLFAGASERALGALFEKNGGGASGLALFAAGSLATRSARFGSDLDLIAVTADERSVSTEAGIVRGLIDDARAIRLGPVDMRLRGEGEGAPLVQTLDYCESYLQARASLWEILAYSKCRFLCGAPETGRAFEDMLARTLPVVFGREGWKARLVDARAKLEGLSKGPWDVKHAAGGLYDIDFLLSAARLRGIIEEPPSADKATVFARLESSGLLERGDGAALLAAYRLFWTMEHAAALHEIPYPPSPEREKFFESYFSRLFSARTAENGTFLERLGGIRNDIRVICERCMPRMR